MQGQKNMKKIILRFWALFPVLILMLVSQALSQDMAVKNELESVLRQFKNYRFGTISVWELITTGEINKVFKQKEQRASGGKIDPTCIKTSDPKILKLAEDEVINGNGMDEIFTAIGNAGIRPPAMDELQCIYDFYKQKHSGGGEQNIEKAYLITTRPEKGKMPDTIIALIISYSSKTLEKNLRSVTPQNIYTLHEMKAFKLDTGFSANNLYDLMNNSFAQAAVENKTLEAQGLGTRIRYAPKVFGVSKSLASNEANVSPEDVQQFLRVSEGQPGEYVMKENELILSPDLISWRKYPTPGYYDNSGAFIYDSLNGSNSTLPSYGLELRYGIDEINYPSFWSERMTVSALWQNVRLGVILPTSGWSSMGKDVFDQNRKLTHGGIGIAGMFDFPIKVIPQSGVFRFSFAYVFGNAVESSYKNRNLTAENYFYNESDLYNDYMIRGNGQLHYTFAVKIDDDYLFRFGIGATVYNAERWYNKLVTGEGERDKLSFVKLSDETVMGISGRIEFMAKNIVTPFGAGIQYFDESLSGNIWLQIPVIQNTLAIRLEAKGYFTAFRNYQHPWENDNVFIPMARFILTF